MNKLMFGLLGAGEAAGRGIAQMGAIELQRMQQEEADKRRQAEFDRQQEVRDRHFRGRQDYKDAIRDENVGGGRGGSGGGGSGGGGSMAGPGGMQLLTLPPEQSAAIVAQLTGRRYEDALAYAQAQRGMPADVPIVDDEYGPQVIKGGDIGEEARTVGAEKFQRAFLMASGKNAEDIATADVIHATGRKPSSLTDEQIGADVEARKALAASRLAEARKDDRTPAGGGRGGGGAGSPKDLAAAEKALRDAEVAAAAARGRVEALTPGEGQRPTSDQRKKLLEAQAAAKAAADAEAQRRVQRDALAGGGKAPASDAPPASMLKEGTNTTFKNGQVWTLQGGKPVRVK